jgi:hypothetical protein
MDGVAVEPGAGAGAHFDLCRIEAAGIEVFEEAGDDEGGAGVGQFGGAGREKRAGGFVADGVLAAGKFPGGWGKTLANAVARGCCHLSAPPGTAH